MKIILILMLLTVAFGCLGQLPPRFITAIHQTETSGQKGAVKGDYSAKTKTYKSLGPLQIQKPYFNDAKQFDKSLNGYQYEDVKRMDVSVKVMNAYVRRYEPKALKDGDLETIARLHNAGPDWRSKVRASDGYWNRVKSNLK